MKCRELGLVHELSRDYPGIHGILSRWSARLPRATIGQPPTTSLGVSSKSFYRSDLSEKPLIKFFRRQLPARQQQILGLVANHDFFVEPKSAPFSRLAEL